MEFVKASFNEYFTHVKGMFNLSDTDKGWVQMEYETIQPPEQTALGWLFACPFNFCINENASAMIPLGYKCITDKKIRSTFSRNTIKGFVSGTKDTMMIATIHSDENCHYGKNESFVFIRDW